VASKQLLNLVGHLLTFLPELGEVGHSTRHSRSVSPKSRHRGVRIRHVRKAEGCQQNLTPRTHQLCLSLYLSLCLPIPRHLFLSLPVSVPLCLSLSLSLSLSPTCPLASVTLHLDFGLPEAQVQIGIGMELLPHTQFLSISGLPGSPRRGKGVCRGDCSREG
jgi:hypothetical protein